MGPRLVARIDLRWNDAWRVVSRPNGPIAALSLLVDDPSELDALVAIEALTNPLAREAAGALSTIPLERRYTGSLADLVMTPFVIPRPSRFSDGSFGVLYAGRTIDTALRETGHYQALRLRAAAAPRGFTLRMYAFSIDIASPNFADVGSRTDTANDSIYDPDSHVAAQRVGRETRSRGSDGIRYDSVRHDRGECVGIFWPDVVAGARNGGGWLYYFDGSAISDYARVA